MFVPFLYELRSRKVPVGAQEAVALAQALQKGLHDSSLDGFYHVARSLLVHSEAHLDAFDEAFLAHFQGIEGEGVKLKDELLEWLREAAGRAEELTPEERAMLDALDPETLKRLFDETMAEQDERHDGGNRWIGTAGKSPFGNSGAARQGIRVGGAGGARSAIKTADARAYKPYRSDLTLDVRQMSMALRKLRAFAREGNEKELDLEGTIDATAKNAGELEIVVRPPRRPSTRVILMMDVGGSMDPYAHLVSRLFTAASKTTHFKELRTYYFHNCVYGRVYRTDKFDDAVPVRDVLKDCARHYKLIMVGDALMAPYELLHAGGSVEVGDDTRVEGIVWLSRLAEHFERSAWLNPEPRHFWSGNTIEYVRQVFEMFPLTLEGLGDAVGHLTKGKTARRA
ncbi:MAG: VWA domain-containing protein, partial [Deltaproteobacteria bacterium]|nr:VWA domain-containing protein [Deltaproteobacteria bacterium]